jgi:hypothetical protein
MKSCSAALNGTFLMSGYDDTWCFLASSIFLYGGPTFGSSAKDAAAGVFVLVRFFFYAFFSIC